MTVVAKNIAKKKLSQHKEEKCQRVQFGACQFATAEKLQEKFSLTIFDNTVIIYTYLIFEICTLWKHEQRKAA